MWMTERDMLNEMQDEVQIKNRKLVRCKDAWCKRKENQKWYVQGDVENETNWDFLSYSNAESMVTLSEIENPMQPSNRCRNPIMSSLMFNKMPK